MDAAEETYLLLLLSDSNLPTGSFVSSSGLESYLKHGFPEKSTTNSNKIVSFIENSLENYARSSLPFASDAHSVVLGLVEILGDERLGGLDTEETLSRLVSLDTLYHAMTLNTITRRSSQSQGVALLTLYSKGFTSPSSNAGDWRRTLIDEYKAMVRRDETKGHQPICWGILTACLGLSLERAQYLHLFLHARSILSSAVRLNTIGPYNSNQLLLHTIRPLVDAAFQQCKDLHVHSTEDGGAANENDGPANTWPLGEILSARHDLQHSRIFNS